MPTKNRHHRETPAFRLSVVYDAWKAEEQASGRPANLVRFAEELGFDSHSAVGEQLNGKRDLSTRVLRECRERWGISSDWLLFGDCPMFAYQCVEPGTIEEQVADWIARRLNMEQAEQLGDRGSVVVSSDEDDRCEAARSLMVDGLAVLESAYQAASNELTEQLQRMDLEYVTMEALRQAQHAAVHGAKYPPLLSHAPFGRLLRGVQQYAQRQPGMLRPVWKSG